MLAIAISLLFGSLAALAFWTIVSSIRQGMAIGRAIVAELESSPDRKALATPAFRPLRGRPLISQPYSRQTVRLRPLRRPCAVA